MSRIATIFVLCAFFVTAMVPRGGLSIASANSPIPSEDTQKTQGTPPSCSPGSLPGEAGVSCTGAGTYAITIDVPPGTNDMQPALSLAYSSQNSDGLLGVGWSVNGLSSVTRCAANMALDGFKGTINYDENDRYCLDNQRLVPKGPVINGVQEYRTEPDTFTRVLSYNTTSTGADYFTAEAKSGLRTEYGNTSDSKIEAQGSTANMRVWAADKMADRSGNYIDYKYAENNPTGEYRIDEIHYTGNFNTGLTPYNLVKFNYTDRVGVPFYQGGAAIITTKLLSSIQTCLNNACFGTNLVKRYDIRYQTGAATQRPRIDLIQQCSGTSLSTCLPATKMTWSDQGYTNHAGNTKSSINGNTKWAEGFGNSDGSFMTTHKVSYADAFFPNISGIQSAPDASAMAVYVVSMGLAAASFIASPLVGAISWVVSGIIVSFLKWFNSAHKIVIGKLGDVNGDGKTDVVGFAKKPLSGDPPTEHVWLANRQSFGGYSFDKQNAWETLPLRQNSKTVNEADNVKLADFNGDGITDVMTYEDVTGSVGTLDGIVYQSNGINAFNFQGMQAVDVNEIDQSSFGDFNGDGKTDIAQFSSNGHVYLNDGKQLNAQATWASCEYIGLSCSGGDNPIENVQLGDVNGDGKTDVVRFDFSNTAATRAKIWLTNKTGTGWTSATPTDFDFGYGIFPRDPVEPDVIMPGDFNGDGKMDLAVFKADTAITTYDTNGDGKVDKNDTSVREAWFYVYLSNGRTFIPQPSFSQKLSIKNAPYALDYIKNSDISLLTRFGDFNGDGKTDLITFDPTKNREAHVLYSDGTKLLPDLTWGGGFGAIDEDYLGDFDGDGRADVLQFAGASFDGQLHVTSADSYPFPDLLVRVTDGYGKKDEYSYKSITDDRVYLGHTSLAGLDSETYQFRGPLYVVASLATSNGTGGMYTLYYQYKGAKAHRSYGFLGFAEIKIIDNQAQRTLTTQYEQRYPLVCHKKGTTARTYIGEQEGPVLSSEGFNWVILGSKAPHIIQLKSQTDIEKEPSGATTKNNFTDYIYDQYSNVTNERVTWPDVSIVAQKTTNTYFNDAVSWTLGLPNSSTVNVYQPNPVPARVTNYTYDYATMLLQSTTENKQPNKTLTTDYGHDPFGNVNNITQSGTDITARSTNIPFDVVGQFPTTITNALNQQSQVSFEPKYGRMTRATDPNALTTAWQYDGFGRQILETRPDSTTSLIIYCPTAEAPFAPAHTTTWVQTKTSGAPDKTTYYDERNREIRTATVGFDGNKIFTDSVYDYTLRLQKASLPYYQGGTSASTVYTYDPKDRITSQTAPDGGVTTYTFTGNATLEPNPITNLTARLLWRKTTQQNALGQKTDYLLNRLDQVNQVNHRDNAGNLLSTMSYDFDGYDNTVTSADANGNISTRTYQDDLMTSAQDPDTGKSTYTYDVLGEKLTTTDAKNNTFTQTYDLLGRRATRTEPESTTPSHWIYDQGNKAIGQLTQMDGPNGFVETYEFDNFGRPLRTNTTIPGDATVYKAERSYDSAGRLDVLRYPAASNNYSVQYHYNSQNYLNNVTAGSSLTSLWQPNSLNALGEITAQTYGSGITGQSGYDVLGRQISMQVGTKPLLKKETYAYDKLNNLTERQDNTKVPVQETVEQFGYDGLNRVTSQFSFINDIVNQKSIPLENHSYQYDKIGNLTFKSDLSTYNPNLFYTGQSGGGPHAASAGCDQNACYIIGYDANGNMIQGQDFQNNVARNADWYSFNKPQKITEGSNTVSFDYNPMHDKVKQVETTGAGTTTTEYISPLLEQVTLPSGVVESKNYIFGTDANPVAMVTLRSNAQNDTRYFHYDNLNSIDVITDENKALVENLSFDDWGQRRNPDWTTATNPITSLSNHGFTNQEQVDAFGLTDMQGRVYDSKIGRFLSADPYITNPLLTENANRYSYVNNNPTSLIDPTGYQVCPAYGPAGAAACVGVNAMSNVAFKSAGTALALGLASMTLNIAVGAGGGGNSTYTAVPDATKVAPKPIVKPLTPEEIKRRKDKALQDAIDNQPKQTIEDGDKAQIRRNFQQMMNSGEDVTATGGEMMMEMFEAKERGASKSELAKIAFFGWMRIGWSVAGGFEESGYGPRRVEPLPQTKSEYYYHPYIPPTNPKPNTIIINTFKD